MGIIWVYVFDGVSDTDFGILISVFGIPVLASLYWYLVSYLRKVCSSDLSLLALLVANQAVVVAVTTGSRFLRCAASIIIVLGSFRGSVVPIVSSVGVATTLSW